MGDARFTTLEVQISCQPAFDVAGARVVPLAGAGWVAGLAAGNVAEQLLRAGTVHVRFPDARDRTWLVATVHDPRAVGDAMGVTDGFDVVLTGDTPLPARDATP